MLGEDTIRLLKRSKSDVEDLIPMVERTAPRESNSTPRSRSYRSLSFTRLADTMKRKGRSLSRSNSAISAIDKETISSPITDPRSPLCPLTPTEPFAASPSPLASAKSSASPRRRPSAARPAVKHAYSASDPTNNHSPPTRPRITVHVPPSLPTASSFGSADTVVGSPLERIAETPFDCDHESAQPDLHRVNRQLADMETVRNSLLPPAMVTGTKARAIQQAKEMEALVAERAKRSGDEPPQYDFHELIGKGAYGRVFKGYVYRVIEAGDADTVTARVARRAALSPSRSSTSTRLTTRR